MSAFGGKADIAIRKASHSPLNICWRCILLQKLLAKEAWSIGGIILACVLHAIMTTLLGIERSPQRREGWRFAQ